MSDDISYNKYEEPYEIKSSKYSIRANRLKEEAASKRNIVREHLLNLDGYLKILSLALEKYLVDDSLPNLDLSNHPAEFVDNKNHLELLKSIHNNLDTNALAENDLKKERLSLNLFKEMILCNTINQRLFENATEDITKNVIDLFYRSILFEKNMKSTYKGKLIKEENTEKQATQSNLHILEKLKAILQKKVSDKSSKRLYIDGEVNGSSKEEEENMGKEN